MVKHYSKKRRLKYVLLALACTTAFTLTGFAAACKKDNPDESASDKTTSQEDTQLLKNGNFEFFTVPDDAVYLINTPTNWSHGGTSSYTMSGIIGTSDTAWDKLIADDLAEKLDYNNSLNSSAEDYDDLHVDYNGMKSSDILYKDTYAALNATDSDADEDESGDDDGEKTNPKELIANPGTHYNVHEKDGALYFYDENGDEKPVYVDENGDYFADEALKTPISHILMLHNYATTHNGIAQSYSSVSVDLPANTAAEISVWVKTAELKYNQGKDVQQDLGANITITNTVGSTTLDNFTINCINTEKLVENGADNSNGWVEYTVYVNACDFASSTISIELGLGESTNGDTVEGYAFFDDVQVTKYLNLEDSSYGDDSDPESAGYAIKSETYNVNSGSQVINGRVSYSKLSNDKSEKVFKADTYERNGELKCKGFSECFNYLLDLASEDDHFPFTFDNGVTVGLTVDEDDYVSARSFGGKLVGFASATDVGAKKLPKDFEDRATGADLLAYTNAGYTFSSSQTSRYETLNTALAKAVDLPKISSTTTDNMLVMLSVNGAAYTATVNTSIAYEGYEIISFWVKTSDEATATVKIYEKDDDENSSYFTVNTKDSAVDIDDDNKDVYDGWTQCFILVKNELKNENGANSSTDVVIEFSIGNTTIKDTTANDYKPGWVALANVQVMDTDEDTFSYAGSGAYTASLTISEEDDKVLNVFDDVYGSQQHSIENSMAKPANYEGVNGGSSYIVNNGSVTLPFDDIDTNGSAGLINKDYVETYKDTSWYQAVLQSFGANYTDAIDNWNEVFGSSSVQPLIILNDKLRDYYCEKKHADETTYEACYIKNDDGTYSPAEGTDYDENETYYTLKQALNYGFITSSDKTLSSGSFTPISVKVKVSEGAVAYIYLTETSNGKSVMTYTAPSYTFRYDADGHVLKADLKDDATLAEQKDNILYYLRDDGLYEDRDKNLFANIWNYKRVYKDRGVNYYDADGNAVNFEDLVDGVTYYKADGSEADCYLVATVDDKEVKVYEYRSEKYYYIVNGESTVEVTPFDTAYAKYDYSDLSEEFFAVIDARYDAVGNFMSDGKLGYDENGNYIAGEWITVTFVIHTGSESKNYRLELWSGSRENSADEMRDNSCVIFDYSYDTETISGNEESLITYYEDKIKEAYIKLFIEKGLYSGSATSTENIDYYRELADSYIESGELTEQDINEVEILKNYTAYYYNYSFYDSVNYQPFNKDVADNNLTGYDYSYEDAESLAYLKIKDGNSYYVFADYSVIEQNITMGTVSDSGDSGESGSNDSNTTVWLLISSIVLVIALLFALMAILVKDMIKKWRRNKVAGKNNYQQRNRYMRRLRITADEYDEVENPAADSDTPAESTESGEAESEPAYNETTTEAEDTKPAEEVEAQSEQVTESVDTPAESAEPAESGEAQSEPAEAETKPEDEQSDGEGDKPAE